MDIKIRKFKNKDTIKVFNIIKKGWRSIISKDYSAEAVENQIRENSPKKIREKSNKIHYFVATNKDMLLGIGGYNKEKVQTFFVNPKDQKKGIGSRIMKKILTEAKKEGISSLSCWSTYHAEKFYNSFGFSKKEKISVQNNDCPISFILMIKKL